MSLNHVAADAFLGELDSGIYIPGTLSTGFVVVQSENCIWTKCGKVWTVSGSARVTNPPSGKTGQIAFTVPPGLTSLDAMSGVATVGSATVPEKPMAQSTSMYKVAGDTHFGFILNTSATYAGETTLYVYYMCQLYDSQF
jgi:hypothetical protein